MICHHYLIFSGKQQIRVSFQQEHRNIILSVTLTSMAPLPPSLHSRDRQRTDFVPHKHRLVYSTYPSVLPKLLWIWTVFSPNVSSGRHARTDPRPLYLGNWQTRSSARLSSSHQSVCARVCLARPAYVVVWVFIMSMHACVFCFFCINSVVSRPVSVHVLKSVCKYDCVLNLSNDSGESSDIL